MQEVSKIGKYFRELSIIVTGIAITVGMVFWVNNKNNEKDLKQYLDAYAYDDKEGLGWGNNNPVILYKKEESLRDRQRIDNGEPIVARLRWIYVNNVPKNMVDKCEYTAEFIRETLSELEKSRIVKR